MVNKLVLESAKKMEIRYNKRALSESAKRVAELRGLNEIQAANFWQEVCDVLLLHQVEELAESKKTAPSED